MTDRARRLVEEGRAVSKSEAKRLVAQGADRLRAYAVVCASGSLEFFSTESDAEELRRWADEEQPVPCGPHRVVTLEEVKGE